jgi:hypothetical protein
MEITYSWVISQLDTIPSIDGLTDVVTTVHYRRTATDGTYFTDIYGAMGCATPSDTDFTAYPDLTEQQVDSWLDQGLDVEAIDAQLNENIENLKNPPLIVLPLPWE